MPDLATAFIARSRHYLTDTYLPKIERSIADLTEEDLWWRPNEASNSIGNLMLHLAGNVRQWIVSGVGGAPDRRERQQEFDQRKPIARSEVLARLRQAVSEADRVLAALDPDQLLAVRRIQGFGVTVFEAVYHVVEHFGMHTGQIALIAKQRLGRDLGLTSLPDPAAPKPRVAFICVENSNRSQMAEAFARMHGGDLIEAWSAGSRPSGQVNPKATAAMRERGYDLGRHRSKRTDALPAGEFAYVVTMGCGDACPWVPAQAREDWPIPDPKDLAPEQFNEVRDEIERRVLDLLGRLTPSQKP